MDQFLTHQHDVDDDDFQRHVDLLMRSPTGCTGFNSLFAVDINHNNNLGERFESASGMQPQGTPQHAQHIATTALAKEQQRPTTPTASAIILISCLI